MRPADERFSVSPFSEGVVPTHLHGVGVPSRNEEFRLHGCDSLNLDRAARENCRLLRLCCTCRTRKIVQVSIDGKIDVENSSTKEQ